MVTAQATAATVDRAAETLVLAVDAGGTKTSAWLADARRADAPVILGRGRATSANPLSIGFAAATRAIAEAIDQARHEGGRPATRVRRAVLSVAGTADVAIRAQFLAWARAEDLAEQVAVVTDMLPVLAAGAADCCGVALVAGTGSVAFARDSSGRTARCGGWGFLLGDDGSGYAIGRAALRHALEHLEIGRGASRLAERVLQLLESASVAAVTAAIYQSADPRAAIAALAPVVVELAAEGDTVALTIVTDAARDLAELVARAARSVGLDAEPLVVAGTGGVLVGSTQLQDQLRTELGQLSLTCELRIVDEPLAGCIRLAGRECAGLDIVWR